MSEEQKDTLFEIVMLLIGVAAISLIIVSIKYNMYWLLIPIAIVIFIALIGAGAEGIDD